MDSPIVLLPGSVLPAEPAYRRLIPALGDVSAVAKDLELYSGPETPPPGYGIETEIQGILRLADERGYEAFHLLGYSAGGASALAFASRHPHRLRSLALLEPAWAGRTGQSQAEAEVYRRIHEVARLPSEELMPAFIGIQLAEGAEPPPPPSGPPPPWMPSRLRGIPAFARAIDAFEPDFEMLRAFHRPVYFALGGASNPDLYARIAERLELVFADFTLDVFKERHHFDPPHLAEPARLASALLSFWERAEAS